MKVKLQNLGSKLLSDSYVKKLGITWQSLFNPAQAVYANRELDLSSIELIGFDMDYTLVVYKKKPMETLQYSLAKEVLIKKYGYPENLNQAIFDQDFAVRGLVVDKQLGNILKLDVHNRVSRALHGRIVLSGEEVNIFYGSKKIKVTGERFYSIDTFFAVPELCLFVDIISCLYKYEKTDKIVENFVEAKTGLWNFAKIFNDVRFVMDSIHADGSLKTKLKEDIELYVEPNEHIYEVIKKIKNSGKKIFLLTNSGWGFTEHVLSFVFDKNWAKFFDYIIVDSKKPGFFIGKNQLEKLPEVCAEKKHKNIFKRGNIEEFHELVNLEGRQILYVGDHIYGDILRSKKDSLWRTCLVVKELEYEIKTSLLNKSHFVELKQLYQKQATLDKRLMRLRTLLWLMQGSFDAKSNTENMNVVWEISEQIKMLVSQLEKIQKRCQEINRKVAKKFHPIWGRLFRENRELSRFGAQIKRYSCIYTANIKNLISYGVNHNFVPRDEYLSHEMDLE